MPGTAICKNLARSVSRTLLRIHRQAIVLCTCPFTTITIDFTHPSTLLLSLAGICGISGPAPRAMHGTEPLTQLRHTHLSV